LYQLRYLCAATVGGLDPRSEPRLIFRVALAGPPQQFASQISEISPRRAPGDGDFHRDVNKSLGMRLRRRARSRRLVVGAVRKDRLLPRTEHVCAHAVTMSSRGQPEPAERGVAARPPVPDAAIGCQARQGEPSGDETAVVWDRSRDYSQRHSGLSPS
jgi:hypothetical protein